MLADRLGSVIGVDPDRDTLALVIVEVRTGVVVFEAVVAANGGGYSEALQLAGRCSRGRRAFAVEGAGSFGAGLTRFLAAEGVQVFELSRLRRERRSGGKTDALDAVRAARSVLVGEQPAISRASGEREALRALLAARDGAVSARTAALNQLRDLLITTPEPFRNELRPLSRARLLARLTSARPDRRQDPELRRTQLALKAVARRIKQLTTEERELAREIEQLTSKLAPQPLDQPGIGPLLAAQLLLSWPHPGRLRSEAAFARLTSAAPIPTSSGQTIRYRLDRSGDRKPNRTLHQTVLTPRRCHQPTTDHINRRTQEGKSRREATRCPKRSLARSLYRLLENPPPTT